MFKKFTLNELKNLDISFKKTCLIFLKGDLGAWKTSLARHIFQDLLWMRDIQVTSPTYNYFNKYWDNYHFDLYRIKDYDQFFAIWGEEVLDNNTWIIIVEWPEIIEKYYRPDIEIILSKTENQDERYIEIIYN